MEGIEWEAPWRGPKRTFKPTLRRFLSDRKIVDMADVLA
jgi:hypothetical protein